MAVRSRFVLALTGAFTATAVVAGGTLVAQAASGSQTAAGKDLCGHLVPSRYLWPGTTRSAPRLSAAQLAAIARTKARLDTERAEMRRLADAAKRHDARKRALLRAARTGAQGPASLQCTLPGRAQSSPLSLVGSGYSYISWMYQYGQVTNYFCGPAAVEEMSATVPGSSPVGESQWTLANAMGTTSSNGTDASRMVSELNSLVGVPDFGWNYYGYVSMDYNPTSAQRTAFVDDLKLDVRQNSPVVGNAYEVYGGPHLVGHPADQASNPIFHYIEIGGWNDNTGQVWYADSATTVWSSVPRYSWYNTSNMETILGGRGYIW